MWKPVQELLYVAGTALYCSDICHFFHVTAYGLQKKKKKKNRREKKGLVVLFHAGDDPTIQLANCSQSSVWKKRIEY